MRFRDRRAGSGERDACVRTTDGRANDNFPTGSPLSLGKFLAFPRRPSRRNRFPGRRYPQNFLDRPPLSVAQPKGVGRARASVSEPLRQRRSGEIATGIIREASHGIPVAILPGRLSPDLETAGLLLISSCLINRLALEACASLATRNACSGVLGRLRPNPGRRQASVTPAPRLRSWLAS